MSTQVLSNNFSKIEQNQSIISFAGKIERTKLKLHSDIYKKD